MKMPPDPPLDSAPPPPDRDDRSRPEVEVRAEPIDFADRAGVDRAGVDSVRVDRAGVDCVDAIDAIDVIVEAERVIAEATAARAEALSELARQACRRMAATLDEGTGDTLRLATFTPAKREELERRSAVAEVACAIRMPESTVSMLMAEAETLTSELPATLASLRAGRVSYRHAQVMISHTDSLPREVRAGFEEAVLPEALALTAAQFDARARKVRERLHPESVRVRAAAARSERCVRLEPARDGMAYLHHLLPVVDAQRIDDTLTRCARAARGPGETRTTAQLRSDALTDLILHRANTTGMAGGNTTSGNTPGAPEGSISEGDDSARHGSVADDSAVDDSVVQATGKASLSPPPTVIVTVPISTLLGTTDEPGELAGYGPIDADTARQLAADAPSLLRMITDPTTGHTLNLGRKRYRPPRTLQLALQLHDETCRFPACNRRASGCEIDHTLAWENGGTTDPGNLAHLCPKHHHLKHETRWTVTQHDDRDLQWTSPTGRGYTTTPAGRTGPPTSASCTCSGSTDHGTGSSSDTDTGSSSDTDTDTGASLRHRTQSELEPAPF